MIKRIIPILIILLIAFSSCVKTVTRTCTCKDAYGQVMSTETHSGDKKSAAEKEPKIKVRDRDKKNVGKRRAATGPAAPTITPAIDFGDGFSTFKQKPQ